MRAAITLKIQLVSKPEMTVRDAEAHIARYFPGIDTDDFSLSADVPTGIVSLTIHQEKLTDEQRDWLHMTPFAARYIDSFTVEPVKVNALHLTFTGGETIAELIQVLNEVSSFVGEDSTLGFGGLRISLEGIEQFTESPNEQRSIIQAMGEALAKYRMASNIIG